MSNLIETAIYTEDETSGFKRTRFTFDLAEIIAAYPEENPVGEKVYCTSVVFRNGDSVLILYPYSHFLAKWSKFKEEDSGQTITFSKN
jgi:hypothetical protein